MSDLAKDISFGEEKELYEECQKKYGMRIKKRTRKRYSMTFIAVILLICLCTTFHNLNYTVVYASGKEGMVQLKEGEKVSLIEEMTPLGKGYTIQISHRKNERFEVIDGLENSYAENIFVNGDTIYWVPDGFLPGKITDGDGSDIQINKTNSSILKIRVYKGEKAEDIYLQLEREETGTYIELLENEGGN
ncbi:MAG TPA: hypothetical protein K8V91_08645 [[Clostridium] spiroforme]|uniref:DUF4367 domain-containing protein n=1 Tax=Thomasclavelia spiroformis TaxID=29348 RepID=A0A921KLE0_9FIRM|nr:hypothetical protein [Thomasclavelia spiroformis]